MKDEQLLFSNRRLHSDNPLSSSYLALTKPDCWQGSPLTSASEADQYPDEVFSLPGEP